MKFLPSVDITSAGSEHMDFWESLTVVILAYFSVISFTILLGVEIQNIFTFLFKQRKYQVYSLALFYIMSIPCLIMRICTSIWIVPIIQYYEVVFLTVPALLKICIGLS